MCGIFGCISLNGMEAHQYASRVERGIRLLHHRGPDGYGVEIAGPACLGHSRLSIIDLEGGAQPMWNNRRTGCITYNGEVYNFPELRERTRAAGHSFTTKSDTEAVLATMLQHGEQGVEQLRGMFALCSVDVRTGKAVIARDRLGIKPLFYTEHDGALWFSSELEPLYKTIGPFRMAPESLDDYLAWQYVPAPRTIYEGVRQLPPGHRIVVEPSGSWREEKYWSLTFSEDHSLSIEDWVEAMDAAISEAVRIRLVSDVPFGAFLSGGVDSSLVTSYMAEQLDMPVRTFSIGFNEADYSELGYADLVAQACGTEHHTEIVEARSLDLLPLLAKHYGQPFADSSAIPTFHVSKMARKHVKMVLSGDGGDENFAGYHSYATVMDVLNPRMEKLEGSLKTRARSALRYFYRLFKSARTNAVDRAFEIHCATAWHFPPGDRRSLWRSDLAHHVDNAAQARRARMDIGSGSSMISRLQHLDLMAYLPYDILTKVDIASMANSLEVRVPLLDHKVVEMAARMPADMKFFMRNENGQRIFEKKYALRKLAKSRFDKSLIDRPKMGFGVPLGKWFATSLRKEVRQRLLESNLLPELLNMESVAGILDSHSESHDLSPRIWNLLFLEEWMRSHDNALPTA